MNPTPAEAPARRTGTASISIDYAATEDVNTMVDQVRSAGLQKAAETFENAYWGFLRVVSAYVVAHPYVGKPEESMTTLSALSVVDYTLRHWAQLVPGSPTLNDEVVLEQDATDESWHREEDRRMRRAAGEEI